jgi:DNA replication protein DnaC
MVTEGDLGPNLSETTGNSLAASLARIQVRAAAMVAECQAHALRLQELTADGTPPEGCPGNLCDGDVIFEKRLASCPLAQTVCPFLAGREKQRMRRVLSGLGIGVRYQNPELERVPGDIRPQVEEFLANLSFNLREGRGLLVSGGVGAGKTSLLSLVAYRAASAGFAVAHWYAPELFDALHNREPGLYGDTAMMDLLCLDDFGVQYAGEWGASRFDALMEERYCKCKAVVVTSNATLEALGKMPQWARVVDRWREMCVGLETKSGSQRRLGA